MAIKKAVIYDKTDDKIYYGKFNDSKNEWVGEREDMTSDILKAVYNYIGIDSSRKILSNKCAVTNFYNISEDSETLEKLMKIIKKQLKEINKKSV